MSNPENIPHTIATLEAQIATLKARAVISPDDVAHLKALKSISFVLWYDPDNAACAKYGKEMEPHIAALCKTFNVT